MRNTRIVHVALGALLLAVTACSSHKVLMPPRVDLRAYGAIGMLDFAASTPELGSQATREFIAVVQSAQPGVPILELGDRRRIAPTLGFGPIDPDTIRAIGERHRVDVLVVGNVEGKRITPSFRLFDGAESLRAGAHLEGALTVRMYDTHSGATLWTTAVSAREPIASVDVASGALSGIGASDPNAVEVRLVRCLVNDATHDFWPYWVRQ